VQAKEENAIAMDKALGGSSGAKPADDDRKQYLELLAEQCFSNEDDTTLYHLALHYGPDPYVHRLVHFDRLVLAERIRRGIEPGAAEARRSAERAYRAQPREHDLDKIIEAEWLRRGRIDPPIEYLATFFLPPKHDSPPIAFELDPRD
jgi:hypothetical protein